MHGHETEWIQTENTPITVSCSSPLESIDINIFEPLCFTSDGDVYKALMAYKYSKLARVVPTSETSSSLVENVLLDFWIDSYGIPGYNLADSGVQFTSKLFATLCAMLALKHLTTAAYSFKLAYRSDGTITRKPLDYIIMLPKTKRKMSNACSF